MGDCTARHGAVQQNSSPKKRSAGRAIARLHACARLRNPLPATASNGGARAAGAGAAAMAVAGRPAINSRRIALRRGQRTLRGGARSGCAH